ncbi:spidroin-2-like [Choloepus didactylus]|uniref:spidroin-2-like n=1 Tax=Choloepus didactylus TaxID=27675 RepID=UPI00189ECF2D|nr:spidroin-2-like [Choloepus didactylus]
MSTPTGRPGFQFWREQILLQNTRTLGPVRAPGGLRRFRAWSASGPDPWAGRRRWGAISPTRRVREPGLAAGGALGGGARQHAHSTPAAHSPHEVGFVSPPVPSPPGKQQRSTPRGKGGTGRRRLGAPRPRRSPTGRVSAGGRRAPDSALRQPSHRGARVPLRAPGLSGPGSGGAQGPGRGHRAAGSGRGSAAPDRQQHGRRQHWADEGCSAAGRSGFAAPAKPGRKDRGAGRVSPEAGAVTAGGRSWRRGTKPWRAPGALVPGEQPVQADRATQNPGASRGFRAWLSSGRRRPRRLRAEVPLAASPARPSPTRLHSGPRRACAPSPP